MNPIKKLLGQTAVYGIGSILGRLVNFIIPLFLSRGYLDPDQLGVHSNLYAYVAFLVVFYSFGMETTFFRYAKNNEKDEIRSLSTSFFFIAALALVSTTFIISFSESIAAFLEITGNEEFVTYLGIVLGVDALTVIPFSYLRLKNKAEKFAQLRLSNIIVNVVVTFFLIGPRLFNTEGVMLYEAFNYEYDHDFNIGYILIGNLVASIYTLVMLLPIILKIRWQLDIELLKKMLVYSYPLVIVALAGQVNNQLDKVLIPILMEGDTAFKHTQLGIYGINYKLAMSMSLSIQAFQMAAEPFFFSQSDDKESPKLFANIMKFFIIFCWLIFLAESLFMHQIKHFIGEEFKEGIEIVPIVLIGFLALGVYYNLSVWYKLTDKTKYGSYIASIGAVITILGNVIFIPIYGYAAGAWTTLTCYVSMAIISYLWGKKHFPIPYNLRKIGFYSILALGMFFISKIPESESLAQILTSTALLLTFITTVVVIERPQKMLS